MRHRLEVAGRGRPIFRPARCGRCTGGRAAFPGSSTSCADRALLGAYAVDRPTMDAATVRRAAAEVLGQAPTAWHRWVRGAAVAALRRRPR